METLIKEEVTIVEKSVSYSMQEGTEIGRRHLKLSEEYTCEGLDVVEKDGKEYVRATLYHENPLVDPEAYTVDLPVVVAFTLETGQLEFSV